MRANPSHKPRVKGRRVQRESMRASQGQGAGDNSKSDKQAGVKCRRRQRIVKVQSGSNRSGYSGFKVLSQGKAENEPAISKGEGAGLNRPHWSLIGPQKYRFRTRLQRTAHRIALSSGSETKSRT